MDEQQRVFSDSDYRLMRFTAILACSVAAASLIILIFWIGARVLSHFSTLLLPLAIAGVLALVLDPVVRLLQNKLHASRLVATIILGLVLILLLLGTYFLVLPETADQARELQESAPELIENVRESVSLRFPRLVEAIESELEEFDWSDLAIDLAPVVEHMSHYAGLAIGLGFVPLYLFFMLMAGNKIQQNARELTSIFSNERQEEIIYLVRMFIGYITAFFQGQLVIALIMGIMLAIGFTVIGLQAAILLGLLLGLLNIVPFLGTIVGLALTLPIAWLQPDGGLALVGLVLLVFAIVQLIESWVLTPRIMSEKSGLHPGIVVVSLFFWGILFGGVIGMILAVPLSAFLVALWRHLKANYLRHLVIEPDDSVDPADAVITAGDTTEGSGEVSGEDSEPDR